MKLREEEFYEQYHQHGGTTIIPTEIFNELYDDATEEIERLKEEYVMLQNASDKVEEELQQRIDKALSYLRDIGNWLRDDSSYRAKLIDILQGSDKE